MIGLHTAALCKTRLEIETITVRVAGQLGEFVANRGQGLRAGTQRVFVTGQLDDPGRIDVQFARQFVHGFARDVRRKFLHARLCQGEEVDAHVVLTPLENRFRVGTQHLECHCFLTDLFQHGLDQWITVMADEVDKEHIGPFTAA